MWGLGFIISDLITKCNVNFTELFSPLQLLDMQRWFSLKLLLSHAMPMLKDFFNEFIGEC
jgi:hypothetical protein